MENKGSLLFSIKRTVAALIDVTLMLIATLFIYFSIVDPIFEKTTDIIATKEEYYQKGEDYNVLIWSEKDFEYIENENATKEEIEAFNNDPIVLELYNKINTTVYQEIILSTTISIAIIYILFPMIPKHGCTLGKKAFGLIVISKNKDSLKKRQVLIREVSFIIIVLIGGVLTYGILPLISLALINFSKKRFSLHDYLSKTTVVMIDKKTKEIIISEDEDEYYRQIAKEEARDLRLGGKKK